MKSYFFLFLFALSPFISRAQKLHLILASDYENKDFGMISLKDEEMVSTMFKKISTQIGYHLQTVYVNRKVDGLTEKAVRNAVSDTSIHPNDIVVFYYSGFGTYPDNSTLPSMQLDNPGLFKLEKHSLVSIDEVAAILQTKRLRLGIVMADCRNKMIDRYPTPLPRNTIVKHDRSKEILKKLFLGEPCRILKISSGQKGKPVFTIQRNSVFTYSLTEAFEDMLYAKNLKEVTLNNLLARINKITKSFIPEYAGLSQVPVSCRPAAVKPVVKATR
ncbi:hypothetical protein GVN20_29080 [Runella sp. CRIBMP]|uniref:caspase family protein n=1 Tax=Runella sp. CRIBMP TaxID=2683261 RepID=UPI00141280F7|nr:caspase family protein [Runella sp. CRIBMP]NBB23440.1 hypothetical protein [Runella sp. CRIBMP]